MFLFIYLILTRLFVFLLQTRELLHYSEDMDAVIIGSLDLCSDYVDDCPWVSDQQYTPQRVRGQLDGNTNRDVVCGTFCFFYV